MFRSFFTTIYSGSSAVLCAVTIPPADLRSLSSYYEFNERKSAGGIVTAQSTTDYELNERKSAGGIVTAQSTTDYELKERKSAGGIVTAQITADYELNERKSAGGIVTAQITADYELNERKSAGGIVTTQSTTEDPLKMVVKNTETYNGFILTNSFFNILLVLNVEVSVF